MQRLQSYLLLLHLFVLPCAANFLRNRTLPGTRTETSDFFEAVETLIEEFGSPSNCSSKSIVQILDHAIITTNALSTVSTNCLAFQNINDALIENENVTKDAALQIFSQTLENLREDDQDMFDAEYFYGLTETYGDQVYAIVKSTRPGDLVDIYGYARQVMISNYTTNSNNGSGSQRRRLKEDELDLTLDFDILMGTRSDPACIARVVKSVQFLRESFNTRNEQEAKWPFSDLPTIDNATLLFVLALSTVSLCFCWFCCACCGAYCWEGPNEEEEQHQDNKKKRRKKGSRDDDGDGDVDKYDDIGKPMRILVVRGLQVTWTMISESVGAILTGEFLAFLALLTL